MSETRGFCPKSSKGKHLIFYDGQCGLCDRVVHWILKHDLSEQFDFAPLNGVTAAKKIPYNSLKLNVNSSNEDTLVLIENYQSDSPQIYILGKAAFRICWLLGGVWKVLGSLAFLPSWMYNWIYRLVAKNRQSLFSMEQCQLHKHEFKNRFLP